MKLFASAGIIVVLGSILSAQAPSVAPGGVLNAASFAKDANGNGSAVAPGSLVQIYGTYTGATLQNADTVPLSTNLGNVSVTFNGVPAPIRNVSPSGQFPFINAQLPFEVQPGTANVVVTIVNNGSSAPQTIPIAASAPGIFTTTANGLGEALFLFVDTDGIAKYAQPASASATLNFPAAPIARGQSGFFYANGLGVLTPPVPDGNYQTGTNDTNTHSAVTPVVMIGGIAAQVQFAGQAPLYPGVNQINIVIPQNAPTGDTVSIQIVSPDGTVKSNSATIAVK